MALDPIYLATAVDAALAAGRVHRSMFRRDTLVEKKGPIDLVTPADLEAEAQFRQLITSRFPDHEILGEEDGGAARESTPPARWRWIIDPLDGTTNFVHGLALFCVSIALEIDGRIDLAVVYDPMGEELFTAERGGGARLNGAPIRVSSRAELGDALLCTGFPYTIRVEPRRQVDVFAGFLGTARAVRRLGSAALDLCYVAAGRFDGFWEEQLHAWDLAAGSLMIEEAGGRVTGYNSEPLDLFAGRIVASNGIVHGPMLDVIREAYRLR